MAFLSSLHHGGIPLFRFFFYAFFMLTVFSRFSWFYGFFNLGRC
ncbi:hypothetical protein SLEP1_g8341 [Rubroshorea leprosula]|uniref:Uncharacterized protein n=1 Tax=Rubroshorea leprosula TaxID=152421 RepID=A0AAV5I712_9ROSI|nr:hypothetical protein SLEP1_g8341 [Rubroshorea leprosula]